MEEKGEGQDRVEEKLGLSYTILFEGWELFSEKVVTDAGE